MARLTSLPIRLAGERVVLRGDRTLLWPRVRTLIVADVHAGKTESLRREGVALPDGPLFDDLVRLAAAIEDTGAERLIVVGDLVHDAQGLTPGVREFVTRWRRTVPCRLDLVIGNHDRKVSALPDEWDLARHDPSLVVSPFAFCHDMPVAGRYSLVGHIHPAVRLSGARDSARVPCFHIGTQAMVLPAFSSLTSGATVRVEDGEEVVAVVQGYVIRLRL
ncbi:MAG: ligase-associated DNA damage response endonuclease PdeM [Gemmatimonadaceae bacterium]